MQPSDSVGLGPSRTSAPCMHELSLPNPFAASVLADMCMHREALDWRWAALAHGVHRLSWDCSYSRGFEVLSQDGLTWIALGMDFSRAQDTRYPVSKHGRDLLWDDVMKLRKVYFSDARL